MKRLFATVLVLLAGAAAAAADTYPSRTVKLLCWTTAGAPLDVMMRQLGKQLADIFGQSCRGRKSRRRLGRRRHGDADEPTGRRLQRAVDHLQHVVHDGDRADRVRAAELHGVAGDPGRAFGGRGARR